MPPAAPKYAATSAAVPGGLSKKAPIPAVATIAAPVIVAIYLVHSP